MQEISNKTQRIGIDARFYGPLGKGLGRYTQEVVDNVLALDTKNDYVIFLSKENIDELVTDNPRVKKVLADVRWYTLAEQIVMPRLIREEKIDLMHFPHFNVPVFCPTKFVVTIHDLILTKFPTMRATTLGPILYFIKNLLYRFVISRAIHNSEQVIAVSNYTKNDIVEQFKISPDRVAMTYEGVATLSGAADDLFAAKEILSGYCILEPYFLYVGNAYPHKNLEALIRVIKKMQLKYSDLKLVLVGKDDYFYSRLKKYAQDINAGSVIFPGYVPDRELDILFKRSLAYVFPSKFEGFGLPPLEAMSRLCPVVSSDQTCLPEVLGDAALYFNPDDENDMKEKLETIMSDHSLRESLIKKGTEQYKLYSWRECARLTILVYDRALAS